MTLYYQLLAVYFVSLVVYILLKLQFSGFDWNRLLHDSVIYLFIILFVYVSLSTIYYLIKKKEIIIEENKITVSSKFKKIEIPFDRIEWIKVKRERRFHLSGFLRTIKIRLKNDKKSIVIRPFDFENDEELLRELLNIREIISRNFEVKNA